MKPPKRWTLFWLLAVPVTLLSASQIRLQTLGSARTLEPLLLKSAHYVLPLFVAAFIASSLVILWPNRSTGWLLANRRYIGLAFAFGIGWHLVLVSYYIARFGSPLGLRPTLLDLIGLTFLLALTLTSFPAFSVQMSRRSWRLLHKTGVYVIWLLVVEIYFGAVRSAPDAAHCLTFAVFLGAGALRVAASLKQKHSRRPNTRASG